MERGTLTKVLQDFLTTVDGELSLLKGDYLLVLSVVDKHWCYGQSHNNTGKFPTNYLHKVDLPEIKDNQNLYISIAPFPGEQAGDLSFPKGQIIVGSNEVEPGWIYGCTDLGEGIFPATHAWKLDTALIKKAVRRKVTRRRARVTADLKAQLDEELDLTKGGIVTVTEILEDGWCRGETEDGRAGTFPQGFIQYLEEDRGESVGEEDSAAAVLPSLNQKDEEYKIYKDFGSHTAMSYDDEPAPCYYELFPEFSREETSQDIGKGSKIIAETPASDNLNPFGIEPYAITLYPFNAQFPNELSFAAGEVVRLIKHKDSEWAEGSIDKATGIFPVSYVNIIVDCPKSEEPEPQNSEETEEEEAEQEPPSKESEVLVPGVVVRVEYNFEAQMDGDLSVEEGDFVTVVEMTNSDWVSVKNEDGVAGLCPRGYLNANFDAQNELENSTDEFVVIRNQESEKMKFEDDFSANRLSAPHRPAPPAPAPGRVPLQKQPSPVENKAEIEDLEEPEATAKQKRADQRQNVISELVITEKEYVRDLKITYETFNLYNPRILESRGVDVTTLFGNMLEVIKIAEELLDKMQLAMKGCDEEFQTIGPCFLKMSDKLQVVYVKYCSNHEAALALLKKYEDNEEATAVFQKGIETLRHQIACFDMSSILIKPVQRILRYPLMLYELIKCTEEDHPDKPDLEEAWRAMTQVASYINEYKRRKDIVTKYFEGDSTLMGKMAKLNMHSVAKKSTRLSAKLSASLGLTNIALDAEFDDCERRFKSLEKSAWQLAADVEQCVVYLSEEAVSGQLAADLIHQYYQGTPNHEVKKLNETRSVIWSTYLQELKSCLERRVTLPLSHLINLLEGPALLIAKRHDKLLDYDVAISKSEKNREMKIFQEELLRAKTNYEALNAQLLEELPTLIEVSTKILVSCFGAFANSRKLLCGKVTRRYLALSETATQITPQDILESFLVGHNLLWNQITRFGLAGSNPRIEESRVQWSEQSERQRILIRKKYSGDRLYLVTENVVSTSSLDLGAKRGTLVAVIKNQDPMGDSTRWFVDNGAVQGFLPRQNLEPCQRAAAAVNGNSASTSPDTTPDLICMDSPEKENRTGTAANRQSQFYQNLNDAVDDSFGTKSSADTGDASRYQNLNNVFYYALYDFDGGMKGTLPIKKGQAVRLLRSHDEMGNDAWWLVQDRNGASGYVPQNYLGTAEALA